MIEYRIILNFYNTNVIGQKNFTFWFCSCLDLLSSAYKSRSWRVRDIYSPFLDPTQGLMWMMLELWK